MPTILEESTATITPLLIGKGKYGCAIKPPLFLNENHPNEGNKMMIFKPYANREDDDISKLFINNSTETDPDESEIEFIKELRDISFIEFIDPEHTFTVEYKGANSVNFKDYRLFSDNIVLSERVIDCMRIKEDGIIYQIILGNGGIDLHKSEIEITYADFLNTLYNFVYGLSKINNIKVHQDIKPANVLLKYHEKTLRNIRKKAVRAKKEAKLSLIDFGLAVNLEHAYTLKNPYLSEDMYRYHPPDYYIVTRILLKIENGMINNNDKLLSEIDYLITELENANRNTELREKYKEFYLNYITTANSSELTKYFFSTLLIYLQQIRMKVESLRYANANYSPQEIMNNIFNAELASKIDIYPLAYIIYELRKKIVDDSYNQDFIDRLFNNCYTSNSFERYNISDIMKALEAEKIMIRKRKNSDVMEQMPKKRGGLIEDNTPALFSSVKSQIEYDLLDKIYKAKKRIFQNIEQIGGGRKKSDKKPNIVLKNKPIDSAQICTIS
jgi:serine/threonine protein kinase